MSTRFFAWIVLAATGALTASAEDELLIKGEADAAAWTISRDLDIDYARQHLVYVFDSAAHHCQADSEASWKPGQDDLRQRIAEMKQDGFIQFTLGDDTPISVEGRRFLMSRLWVSLRDQDGATFN